MTEWQAFRHPKRLYTLHHPPDWTVTVDEALGQVILRPPFPPHSYLDITVHLLTDEQWQSLGGIQGLMDIALQAVWRATPQSWWQRIWQRFLLPSKPSMSKPLRVWKSLRRSLMWRTLIGGCEPSDGGNWALR